jgi:hypothetical protein
MDQAIRFSSSRGSLANDKPKLCASKRLDCGRAQSQAVNFALNAWGDDVFLAIAEGAIKVRDASV